MLVTRRQLQLGIAAACVARADAAQAADGLTEAQRVALALVDPELRAGADAMLAEAWPPLSAQTLQSARASWIAPPVLGPPAPAVETRLIPGRAGDPDVPIQIIGARPGGAPRPALLHIHGGGFVMGSAQHLTSFCQTLSAELDCVVVNVEYRLSPETRFPGPVEDNYAALKWLHENADALGVKRDRIAVMGESAGGGYAALLALTARDRGEIPICYQVLIYPMLDDRTGGTRHPPSFMGAIGWRAVDNRFAWEAFLGVPAGSRRVPRGAVPARAETLANLPPAFIGVGALDLFVNEDVAYAARLLDAGVPAELHVVPGAYHDFDFMAPESRVSRAFAAAWKAGLLAAFS